MVTNEFKLSMTPQFNNPVVGVSQYDTGARTLKFNLYANGAQLIIPSGTTAVINGAKPDGTAFSYPMTVGDTYVQIAVQEQMTAVAGTVIAEIVLTGTDGSIGTSNFKMMVERSPLDEGVISESDISVIQEAVEDAQQAAQQAQTVLDSIPADYTELSDAVNVLPSGMFVNLGKNKLTSLTYRGVTAKYIGNKYVINGTSTGSTRFKISNTPATGVSTTSNHWDLERIGLTVGHEYLIYVKYLSGNGDAIEVGTYGSANANVINKINVPTDGSAFGTVFVASDTNSSCVCLYTTTGRTYDNLTFETDLIDITVAKTFTNRIDANFPTWTTRLNAIQKLQSSNFTFAVQTDTHMTGDEDINYVYPLTRLTNTMGFDFVCNLGDMNRGYETDTTTASKNAITNIMGRYANGLQCPMLYALGNHEDSSLYTKTGGNNSLDECILKGELYAKIMKLVNNTTGIVSPDKDFYYYVDFDDARVIVLNTHDVDWSSLSSGTGVDVNSHVISNAQVTWLETVALNTHKPVAILCHTPLLSSLTSTVPTNADAVVNKINAFKNNGGTVIGVFCGHAHNQNSAKANDIPHIVFANGGNFAEIVIVNTTAKTITTRMVGDYGNLVDRSFTF